MSLNDADLKPLAKMLAEKYWTAISLAIKTGEDLTSTRHKHAENMAELTAGWSDARAAEFHELYASELNLLSSAEDAGHSGEAQAFQNSGSDFISRKVDRASVREYVRRNSEALVAAATRGENVHQLALDQQDAVNERIAAMSSADAAAFEVVYFEELQANTSHMNAETQRINQRVEVDTQNAENFGKIVGFVVFVIIVVALFSSFKR